ncbi:Wadjet anti-phage system protein JetD domain-containing protein [Paenibacillus sp. GCM10028914]|uniref:Wadjet anti-phage system protein JetD domain-containing protein n=1 Tax=Paenibacillus sp. GCM10028914 TaxID=3273416 RepID=UPI00361B0FAA
MNYATKILNELIDKYNNSSHRKGSAKINRRIKYDFTESNFPEYFHDGLRNQRDVINHDMITAAGMNFISIEWLYVNQIIKKVYLNIDYSDQVCEWLGRPKMNTIIEERIIWFEQLESKLEGTWMQLFAQDCLTKLYNQDLPSVAQELSLLNLLEKALVGLKDKGEETLPERLFSKKYLGDSKIFEQQLRNRIISLYKKYSGQIFDWEIDVHVLEELGIETSNEEPQVTGNLVYELNGIRIDLSPFQFGIGLNKQMIRTGQILEVKADQLLIIENKAVYLEYIKKHKKTNEVVVYVGGFPGAYKRRLLMQIYNAATHNRSDFVSFFWGDIDLGGFNIYTHIRERVIPNLQTYNMDKDTFIRYKLYAEPIDITYRSKLSRMLGDPRYELFQTVLEAMLEEDLRLEQEAQLL